MKRILLIGALLLSMAGLKAQQRTYTDEEIKQLKKKK